MRLRIKICTASIGVDRTALTVARRGYGLEPMVLARENFADLNLSPANVERQNQPPSWFGNHAPRNSVTPIPSH
ncbi:MAG: hypothetical protein V3T62_10880 [Alphaproteobacteria bacterium]